MNKLKLRRGLLAIPLLFTALLVVPNVYANFALDSVNDVGVVDNFDRPGLLRDGGVGAVVGDKFLWAFGDTLFSPASVDGVHGRSNSAAVAELNNPLSVSEPLDANNAPYQFIEFSSTDKAYNDAHGPDDRYAIWPTAIVAKDANSAYVYYTRLKIDPGWLNYTSLSTGVAEVGANQTVATRINDNLFTEPISFASAGFGHQGYAYLYGCEEPLAPKCRVARAPLSDAANAAGFQFWDGTTWNADPNAASATLPGSTIGYGVAWNQYLQKFVMAYAPPFTEDIELRFADAPQGPWSEPQKIYTAPPNSGKYIRAVYLHPELSLDGGRTMPVSYYLPSVDDDITKDKKRMLEVKFAEVAQPGGSTGTGGGTTNSSGNNSSGGSISNQSAVGAPKTGAAKTAALLIVLSVISLTSVLITQELRNHKKSPRQ